jgi:hypothetical protein
MADLPDFIGPRLFSLLLDDCRMGAKPGFLPNFMYMVYLQCEAEGSFQQARVCFFKSGGSQSEGGGFQPINWKQLQQRKRFHLTPWRT